MEKNYKQSLTYTIKDTHLVVSHNHYKDSDIENIRGIDGNRSNKSMSKEFIKYLPFFRKYLLSNVLVYTKYESAELGMLPFKPSPGIKDRALIKAERDKYVSENGEIKRMYYITSYKDIVYDTRAFKKIMVDQQFIED